jgi:hypothetical protein
MSKEKQEAMMSQVKEWRGSGMSGKAYAQKIGVSKSKFDYWVRKEKFRQEATMPCSQFIEIGSLSEDILRTNEKLSPGVMNPSLQIELSFPSGLCLKIYG